MGTFSIWHWLVVLAIVLLVFGTKKLRNLGGDLGSAIRNFKSAMKDEGESGESGAGADSNKQLPGDGRIVDAEVTNKEKHRS